MMTERLEFAPAARSNGGGYRRMVLGLVMLGILTLGCRKSGLQDDGPGELGPPKKGAQGPGRPGTVGGNLADPKRTPSVRGGGCNDGIDDDGDGLVDWQLDPGCFGPDDPDETAGGRSEESGFTTYDPAPDSRLIYVSSSQGQDGNNGSSPSQAVKTLRRGAELVRDGHYDFLRLRRGDTWRGESLGEFKSGRGPGQPLVVGAYGETKARPRVVVSSDFINHSGQVRSNLALVGLEIVALGKEVGGAEFDGVTGGGIRFVGAGQNLLIENCHLRHAGINLQSYGHHGDRYTHVELRRSIIERVYDARTCANERGRRPAGMFTKGIDDLLIEENVFDHNGWDETVAGACATMFNHNMYLNASHLRVRGNVVARASSIGIKMKSQRAGDADDLVFEGNVIFGGEVGMTIGGNKDGPDRFSKVLIRRNVFSEIGVEPTTGRHLAWGLLVKDNVDSVIENNLFLNQDAEKNSLGLHVSGNFERHLRVEGNTFYGVRGRALRVTVVPGFSDVLITGNHMMQGETEGHLVQHEGPFRGVTYQGNRYFSAQHTPFAVDKEEMALARWREVSGEQGALEQTGAPPTVPSVASYAQKISPGKDAMLEFLARLRGQLWVGADSKLTADSIQNYIRAGFPAGTVDN